LSPLPGALGTWASRSCASSRGSASPVNSRGYLGRRALLFGVLRRRNIGHLAHAFGPACGEFVSFTRGCDAWGAQRSVWASPKRSIFWPQGSWGSNRGGHMCHNIRRAGFLNNRGGCNTTWEGSMSPRWGTIYWRKVLAPSGSPSGERWAMQKNTPQTKGEVI